MKGSSNNPKFILKCLNVGDSFLGCSSCGFQLEPGCIAKPICPNCQTRMSIFTVEDIDLENLNKSNRT